jgi:hypothetical protein
MPLQFRRLLSLLNLGCARGGQRLNPARDWIASLVLLCIGVALGLSALPSDLAGADSALRLVDAQRGGAGIAPAVFVLRDDGVAVRFGNADITPAGIIRVGLYDPLEPLLGRATEAVSLPADARLLWLLASPPERQGLRDRTAALAVALTGGLRDMLASPEFAESYRDRFMTVFKSATRDAWQATQDNGAWRALMRGSEPILRETLVRDVRPLMERHFRSVPMALLRANAMAIVDPFTDRTWNMQPVEDALKAGLAELRDRDVAERTISRLFDSPATAEFLRGFQDTLARKLAHSVELQNLIAEMLFDERLRPYVAEAVGRAYELGRAAPRLLISLRGSTDLNLVASTVIRTTIGGRPDRVVLFMSPAQRDEIMTLDRTAAHVLSRADAG